MEVIQLLNELSSSIGVYKFGEWIRYYGIAIEEHQKAVMCILILLLIIICTISYFFVRKFKNKEFLPEVKEFVGVGSTQPRFRKRDKVLFYSRKMLRKVKDNISTLFTKFVNEGKATIRFKDPQHDLILTSNPLELKAFLHTLQLVLLGTPLRKLQLRSLCSTQGQSAVKPLKTKLAVKCKRDYPTISGFPRTLEVLQINNAELKSFDRRILRLSNLRVLDLAANCVPKLPEALGVLSSLVELHLSDNVLGKNPDWRWLLSPKLGKNLRLLDLRFNQITYLPDQILKLRNLVTLRLDGNKLKKLPRGIGNFKTLSYLTASKNHLLCLPGSIINMRLDAIDVTGNCFTYPRKPIIPQSSFNTSSLLDLAAKQAVKHRIHVSEEIIPHTLVQYLENCTYCTCGNPSFTSSPLCFTSFNLCKISSAVTRDSTLPGLGAPVETRFCSFSCYQRCIIFIN